MRLNLQFLFFLSVYLLLFKITCQNSFFWDTIQLASQHAQWFYEQHFRTLILPESIDSGHPPLLGIYLALIWSFFGKTLFVSHSAMLPFIMLLIFQTLNLTKNLFSEKFIFLSSFLILSESTLLTQCTLVSPDVILAALFITALNQIITNNRKVLLFSILFLSLVSMRGMMCAFMLYIFYLYNQAANSPSQTKINLIFTSITPFIPGGVLALSFLVYHYYQTGWIGYHVGSPWESSFKFAGIMGMIKNLFILLWRLIDFGKILTWLLLPFCFVLLLKKKLGFLAQKEIKNWLLLCVLSISVLALPLAIYKNLLAHRYLIPVYIIINLFAVYLISQTFKTVFAQILLGLLIVCQLLGNLWSYPRQIAVGWDSTLSHLPYYNLRIEAIKYLKDRNIPLEIVGTGFPNDLCLKDIDLSDDPSCFATYDMSKNTFIMYSNVYNDFTNEEINQLFTKWEKVKELKKGAVEIILFKRKD